MKPASNVRRRSRPLPVQREELSADKIVAEAVATAAAVEMEVVEAEAGEAEAVTTAPAPRAQFR